MTRKHTAWLNLVLGAGLALPAVALAEAEKDPKKPAAAKAEAKSAEAKALERCLASGQWPCSTGVQVPWRGSAVTLANTFNARQLDKGADLSWNPYDAVSVNISPRYWLGDHLFLRGNLTLTHELTKADDETFSDEVRFLDTTVGAGYLLPSVPVIDLTPAVTFDVRLPTSKLSRFQGLNAGLHGGLSLTENFKLLSGLSLTYFFGARKFFHDYTTSGLNEPSIGGGSAGTVQPTLAGGANDFMNTGVRNASWQFIHSGSVWLGITPWLNASVSVATVQSKLYDLQATDADAGSQALVNTDDRFAINYTVSLGIQPWDVVGFNFSSDTFNPQLNPTVGDTYYAPFFNRFTNIVASVRFNVGALK
jgi:hypothetical protein